VKLVDEYDPFLVEILEEGNYIIIHKEEVLLQATTTKVWCYVELLEIQEDGSYPDEGISIAVFDWE
jgi:hypothetical protein